VAPDLDLLQIRRTLLVCLLKVVSDSYMPLLREKRKIIRVAKFLRNDQKLKTR
jgi:hypothetical protein